MKVKFFMWKKVRNSGVFFQIQVLYESFFYDDMKELKQSPG